MTFKKKKKKQQLLKQKQLLQWTTWNNLKHYQIK